MSDVSLEIKSSSVHKEILSIVSNSDVQDEVLILEDGKNYVKRFSPPFVKDNDTIQSIYEVEREEMENFHDEILINIDNTYIQSLNISGIQKWEKVLHLESNAELPLDTRHELILTKRRFRPPFTRQNLQNILESVWGKGNYLFEIYPNEFELIIDIHTNYPEVYIKFQDYIRSLIPANMYVIFAIQYTYLYLLRNMNYNEASVLTYGELSKYA